GGGVGPRGGGPPGGRGGVGGVRIAQQDRKRASQDARRAGLAAWRLGLWQLKFRHAHRRACPLLSRRGPPVRLAPAERQPARCLGAGMVGIKLAASRRATDPLLDPICELARERGVPVLHHVWQHRTRDWPGQDASDGPELVALATRHPQVRFILAHIGGGGDWEHSLAALRATPNVYVALSGSGGDGGMLEACLEAAEWGRLLWGTELRVATGWAKLRYLERLLPPGDLELVQWRNAARIF